MAQNVYHVDFKIYHFKLYKIANAVIYYLFLNDLFVLFFRCDPEFGCLKLTETSTKLDISSSRQSEHGNTQNNSSKDTLPF